VDSKRFGAYAVPAERVILFPEGLIGMPDAQRFALMEPSRPESPFRQLLCLDLPELGFVVCDPEDLWPGYGGHLPPYEGGRENLAAMVLVTVPTNPKEMTANLLAPLVVDARTRVGRQIVLDAGRLSTRHPIFPPDETASSGGGATA
jgi:flagellar assembly factor FliW